MRPMRRIVYDVVLVSRVKGRQELDGEPPFSTKDPWKQCHQQQHHALGRRRRRRRGGRGYAVGRGGPGGRSPLAVEREYNNTMPP